MLKLIETDAESLLLEHCEREYREQTDWLRGM